MSKSVNLAEYSGGGALSEETFSIIDQQKPSVDSLKGNQLLVKVTDLSVDPHMRLWFSSSAPDKFTKGQPIIGIGVGVVEASTSEHFKVGDAVSNRYMAWANYAIVDASTSTKLETNEFPLSAHLGVLGMPSFTAYMGTVLAKPKQGETILVSIAAGAVGQVVVQLVKSMGLYVIAVAGSDEKCEYVKSLGADVAINYRSVKDMSGTLAEVAPNGFDIYWDNVGGEFLDIVLTKLKKFARVIVCGAISQYSATGDAIYGLKNLYSIIESSSSLIGFLYSDYIGTHHYSDFIEKFTTLAKEGKIKFKVDIVEGIDHAPRVFNDLFASGNFGKRILHIANA